MAPRTKTTQAPIKTYVEDSPVVTIGLDIGYGAVKAILPDGQTTLFPSIYGQAREIKFKADDIAAKYPGDQISDEAGDWFVGNLALKQLTAGEHLYLRGRSGDEKSVGNEFRLRMAKVAIGKLLARVGGDVVHIRLATGLPVSHMPVAAGLKEMLLGQHVIKTDQADFIANISEVKVMPQPYGTIYRQMLTERGDYNPGHTAARTGVVDVGTYSVDITLDDQGDYIESESDTVESGIYVAQEAIADIYEKTYRNKPKVGDVETILRTRQLKIRGETIYFDQEVEAALEPVRRATIQKMQHLWGAGERIDVIYLSGGGAYFIEDEVRAVYPQAVVVDNAQFANVRGYLNYALLVEKNEGR